MTHSQILRGRGWEPDGKGWWKKRGWELPIEDAYALESLLDRAGKTVPLNHPGLRDYLMKQIEKEKHNRPFVARPV
jgi:hypothetical protein